MYELLLEPLHELKEYRELLDQVRKDTSASARHAIELVGLSDSQRAHVLAALEHDTNRPLLIVTSNQLIAEHLLSDLARIFDREAAILPAREIRFTSLASSRELSSRRLDALYRASRGKLRALIVPVDAMLHRLLPREKFESCTMSFHVGESYDITDLLNKLISSGYERVDMIEGRGQIALRGGILDIYSPGDMPAVRIEFFDDEVDSIRVLDVLTQRSGDRLNEAIVLPASEAPIAPNDPRLTELAYRFEKLKPKQAVNPTLPDSLHSWDEGDDEMPDIFAARESTDEIVVSSDSRGTAMSSPEEDPVEQPPAPIETSIDNLIPLLFDHTEMPCDYMDNPIVVLDQPERLSERCENIHLEFVEQYRAALEHAKVLQEQSDLLYTYGQVLTRVTQDTLIALSPFLRRYQDIDIKSVITINAMNSTAYSANMREMCRDLDKWRDEGWRVALLAGGHARAQRLEKSLLDEHEIVPFVQERTEPIQADEVVILPIALECGFVYPDIKFCVITETDMFGTSKQRPTARKRAGEKISAFTDLKVGDYVVHESHGIGIYRGMVRLCSEGVYRDYLHIDYLGNDRLYVPTDQLDRVQKYIGREGVPPKLNRMSGSDWQKQKARVKAEIKDMADELVKLYAQRTAADGFAFSPDTPWQREFEDAFPYEETPDQLQSIEEIKADMEKKQVMDRLLCGDVGYGKTEVALRAAFKAVMDSKQVALLAPTTILVQQHYQTILKRFGGYPVRVDTLSRFKTAAQQRDTLRRLAAGEIDILVGTHRMLAKDVFFKDLGLLIVDEEQRFGVKHKEAIKKLKTSVDVLTLSATPIPRTLHMSMVGIRDMSVLETPPEERFPVQTYVVEYNDGLVRDAIMRELQRGGQVYALYNRVGSIERFHAHLKELVPEARIAIGHGQMAEHDLEDVMLEFYNGEYDVLLCTTIIESGLDVANANTMIVYDADRFGLSQLYQLRGRVGRSNRLAYCYLCVKSGKVLTETADKRLSAIREFTEFGSGFRVAMRDLEIRGAGNLLGAEQHGHLSTVGYDLYCKMVEDTMRELRGEATAENVETHMELHVSAYLPMDYVSGDYQRIEVYKKISQVASRSDWADMIEELTDRFGDPVRPVMNLIAISYMRKMCEKLWIATAASQNGFITLKFLPNAQVDIVTLLDRVNKLSGQVKFVGGASPALVITKNKQSDEDFLNKAIVLLEKLTEDAPESAPQTAK